MKDHQANKKRIHGIAAICCAAFMIVIAGPTAVPQLKPASEIPSARQPSQTPSGRSATRNEERVIVNTDLVTLTVSVADSHGRYVPGLDKKDFTISDNKPHLVLAQSLLERGCLWNSFLMVGQASAFLEMIRRAVPDLYDLFVAAQKSFATGREDQTLSALYQSIPSINFSQEVSAKRNDGLAVLSVSEVGWSDWGEPGRVLTTLASLGVHTQWAVAAN